MTQAVYEVQGLEATLTETEFDPVYHTSDAFKDEFVQGMEETLDALGIVAEKTGGGSAGNVWVRLAGGTNGASASAPRATPSPAGPLKPPVGARERARRFLPRRQREQRDY